MPYTAIYSDEKTRIPNHDGEYDFCDAMSMQEIIDDGFEDDCLENKLLGYEVIKIPNTYTPRLSPKRMGLRINGEHGDKFSSILEYTHVSTQNKTSNATIVYKDSEDNDRIKYRIVLEDKTDGYHLLNAGIDYHGDKGNMDYTISLRANNLLNERIYIHNSFLPYVLQMGRNVSLALTMNF